MTTSHKLTLLTSFLLAVGASLAAQAGVHNTTEVTITLDATGTAVTGASGALFSAYDSADTNQLIGCGGLSSSMWCQAHDARPNATGVLNQAFCSTINPELMAQIRSISPQSYISFGVNPATGECTKIYVSHNSSNLRH
jgi:hypothetical protein